MNLHKLLSFEQGRIVFFETLTKHPENWQQNTTPLSIVRKMLDKTSLDDKKILVLFNIEFLQVLVEERKINPENIYYIADNDLEYLSAIKIFKVQSYKLHDFTVPALKNLIVGLDMKFDLVFSNPPYNSNIDIKILNEIIDIADEFVFVHPSTWILDTKGKTKLYKEFINKINDKKCNFEFFNGNPVFDIDLFLPCVISHIQMNSQGESFMNYFGKTYNINDVFSVTKFGDKWKSLVLPFRQKIEKYISNSNSVWTHFSNNKTNSFSEGVGFLFQFPMGRGNCEISSNSKMLKDDFYSFFSSNQQEIDKKNKSQKVAFSGGTYYYFKTQIERDNFSEYLKTDFARFCLALTKNNKHLDTGELELIPWLDFTDEWGDEKLFEKFNVSQELQDYIRDFLPDYYGIRK